MWSRLERGRFDLSNLFAGIFATSVIRGDWDVAAPVVRGEVWGAGQS